MKKAERILLHGSNLWYLGEGMLGPLFAIFAERVGGDVLDIAWAWATFLIVSGLLSIFSGKLSDHYDKEKMLVLGYALNAFFTFCYLFISAPIHLFLVQIGLGMASAIATPAWSALYDKYSSNNHQGYIWGLASGEADIIRGIALVIGGFIVSYFSFSALFIVMGVIQVVATIFQARILKRRGVLEEFKEKIIE